MGEAVESSVTDARNKFSEAVNRAVHDGEITYVILGRSGVRAAAIVPASLVEAYEELLDREDARIADERLAESVTGTARMISSADLMSESGL